MTTKPYDVRTLRMALTSNRTATIILGRNDYIWGPLKRQRLRIEARTILPWYLPPSLCPSVVTPEALLPWYREKPHG